MALSVLVVGCRPVLSVGRIDHTYLLRRTASHDAPRAGEALHGYYQRTGFPPGTWVGREAANLGLQGEVSEDHMHALYGRCHHPRTGEALGRKVATYRSVEERVQDRLGALDHPASEAESAAVRAEEEAKGTRGAVTTLDLTYSAPKSVSVLWAAALAAGEEDLAGDLRGAHEAAWRASISFVEEEVAATRMGRGGVAQVDTEGICGAAFEHWWSRAGDPDLHTHVALSAMVRGPDGAYRRLDSRGLYRGAAAAGEVYTATLMDEVARRCGLSWRHRTSGRSGTLLPELAGVPDEVIAAFSTRAAQVEANLARIASDYRARHGYAPTREVLARLAQQATLEARPGTIERPLGDQLARWSRRLGEALSLGPEAAPGHQVGAAREAGGRPPARVPAVTEDLALSLAARLTDTAATWSGRDAQRAARAILREQGHTATRADAEALVGALQRHRDTVALGAPDPGGPVPRVLRRRDGTSVFARRGEERYTTREVLRAEEDLARAARVRHLPAAEATRRSRVPYGDVDDATLVERLVAGERQVAALEERAGSLRRLAGEATGEAEASAGEAARIEETRPALARARAQVSAEEDAWARYQEIRDRLGRGRVLGPRRGERERLEAEAAGLARAFPGAVMGRVAHDRVMAQDLAQGERADQEEAARARERASRARTRAEEATGEAEVTEALLGEHREATGALKDELGAREASPGRVVSSPHLAGLGPDQAGAVVRLADPSRPLDALVGPAGAGKTTALAALVGSFTEAGRGVWVLAPTARAAGVAGEAVGQVGQTLDQALARWGRDDGARPARGDLVLIDEASMAPSHKLARAVRVAGDRGALVRLVGDPNQLKAVGPGGALEIVAREASSPELRELWRFEAPWEEAATLSLRRGDPSVVATYRHHDRIREGLGEDVVARTYAAWSEAGGADGGAVMVASDNRTAQALSLLARAERVAAGEVEEGGVALADGSLAGVGDLVVTRRNDRRLSFGRGEGAYVRNRDRWEVLARGEDGSLRVSHLGCGGTLTLPGDYVARDVELSYAFTGHGAQGITAEASFAVLRASDTRWYAYVALTRGRRENVAMVVTDSVEDEPRGGPGAPSGDEVFARVLANDEAVSATAHREADHGDLATLVSRYEVAARAELEDRLRVALRARGAEDLLAHEEAGVVVSASARLEARGGDAPRALARLPGKSLASPRAAILHLMPSGPGGPGVLHGGLVARAGPQVAPDVASYLDQLGEEIASHRNGLMASLRTGAVPHWAVALGPRPEDPPARDRWAEEVAQVWAFREAWGISGDEVLPGPRAGPGDPSLPARARAERAEERARAIATGRDPDQERLERPGVRPDPGHRRPGRDMGPSLGP